MTLFFRCPFPADNSLLEFIHAQRPGSFRVFGDLHRHAVHDAPLLFSFAYIFVMKPERKKHVAKLAPYPKPVPVTINSPSDVSSLSLSGGSGLPSVIDVTRRLPPYYRVRQLSAAAA